LRKTNYDLGGERKAKPSGAPETLDADRAGENASNVVFVQVGVVLVLALGSALIISLLVVAFDIG
jgi:hypothetical protein